MWAYTVREAGANLTVFIAARVVMRNGFPFINTPVGLRGVIALGEAYLAARHFSTMQTSPATLLPAVEAPLSPSGLQIESVTAGRSLQLTLPISEKSPNF